MSFIVTTPEQQKFNPRFNKYGKYNQNNNQNKNESDTPETVLRLEPNIGQLVNTFCKPYKHKSKEDGGSSGDCDSMGGMGMVMSDMRKVPYMSADIRNTLQIGVNKCIIKKKVCVCAYICVYVCVFVCVCMCMCACVYVWVCMYIHTCILLYKYINLSANIFIVYHVL